MTTVQFRSYFLTQKIHYVWLKKSRKLFDYSTSFILITVLSNRAHIFWRVTSAIRCFRNSLDHGLLERTRLLKLLFSFITHNNWFSRNPNFQKLACLLLMIIFMCRWDFLKATYLDKKNPMTSCKIRLDIFILKTLTAPASEGKTNSWHTMFAYFDDREEIELVFLDENSAFSLQIFRLYCEVL